jgi:hypothetical protein
LQALGAMRGNEQGFVDVGFAERIETQSCAVSSVGIALALEMLEEEAIAFRILGCVLRRTQRRGGCTLSGRGCG